MSNAEALQQRLEHYRTYLSFRSLNQALAELREVRTHNKFGVTLRFVQFLSDGKGIVVSGKNASPYRDKGIYSAQSIDAMTGKPLARWNGTGQDYAFCELSPDDKLAVTAGRNTQIIMYQNGSRLKSATYTNRVAYVWNTKTGRDVIQLRKHRDAVVSARFSSNGKQINGLLRRDSAAVGSEVG